MATLIAVYKGTQCVGRCDAHCYNATDPSCDCICGGKNHGVGQKAAEQNTRQHYNQWIKSYIKRKKLPKDSIGRVNAELFQGTLF